MTLGTGMQALMEQDAGFVQPAARRNEVLGWVKEGLRDFSISRAAMAWGIPIPQDPAQTVYVWFDALLGYMSGQQPLLDNTFSDRELHQPVRRKLCGLGQSQTLPEWCTTPIPRTSQTDGIEVRARMVAWPLFSLLSRDNIAPHLHRSEAECLQSPRDTSFYAKYHNIITCASFMLHSNFP